MTAPDASALPLIGITMGDPLGIGPEVLVKALSDTTLRRRARFVVYGLHDVMEYAADQAEISQFWWREPYDRLPRVGTGVLVADFDHLRVPRANGEHGPDLVAGDVSFRFVDAAIEHLGRHDIDALVTGPICKASWSLAGQKFAGHTELLAKRFNTRRVTMAFIAGDMRVALASAHVPLFELRNQFTIGLVHQPIDLLDQALREWFGIARPHIGVLGLNPHAGEAGLLGDEELRVIEPAMTMARDSGIHVSGPLPADTAFIPENLRRYDGIVAMYHDQGLIPVKMRAFNAAVNVTLGLEALRTSPDHGTAFDIAGKNLADPGSMKAAIGLAIELAEQRRKARAAAAASADASGAHPGM